MQLNLLVDHPHYVTCFLVYISCQILDNNEIIQVRRITLYFNQSNSNISYFIYEPRHVDILTSVDSDEPLQPPL